MNLLYCGQIRLKQLNSDTRSVLHSLMEIDCIVKVVKQKTSQEIRGSYSLAWLSVIQKVSWKKLMTHSGVSDILYQGKSEGFVIC